MTIHLSWLKRVGAIVAVMVVAGLVGAFDAQTGVPCQTPIASSGNTGFGVVNAPGQNSDYAVGSPDPEMGSVANSTSSPDSDGSDSLPGPHGHKKHAADLSQAVWELGHRAQVALNYLPHNAAAMPQIMAAVLFALSGLLWMLLSRQTGLFLAWQIPSRRLIPIQAHGPPDRF